MSLTKTQMIDYVVDEIFEVYRQAISPLLPSWETLQKLKGYESSVVAWKAVAKDILENEGYVHSYSSAPE